MRQYAHACPARARVWDVDNREAPVRLCASGGPNSQNWEFKALDATANPYLALAAILLAGCDVRSMHHIGFSGFWLVCSCLFFGQAFTGGAHVPTALRGGAHKNSSMLC